MLANILLPVAFLVTQNVFAGSREPQRRWTPLPLRTAAQVVAGVPGGEGMQMIWDLEIAPSNRNVAYLVSDTSQVWRSSDGGTSWQMCHRGFLANGAVSLAIDPANENLVLAAGSVHIVKIVDDTTVALSDDTADGIYRTVDGGESWELVRRTAFFRPERHTRDPKTGEIVFKTMRGGKSFAFSSRGVVYAATHTEGLLKSADKGATWVPMGILAEEPIWGVVAHPDDPSIAYVIADSGLYRLTDGDRPAVERVNTLLQPGTPRSLVFDPSKPRVIYVATAEGGIQKSTDGGRSFSFKNIGLDPLNILHLEAVNLAISPVNPSRLYVSFSECAYNQPYFTVDGGETWRAPGAMDTLLDDIVWYGGDDQRGSFWGSAIAVDPVDENVALTVGGGDHIIRTADGGVSWAYSSSGYTGGRAAVSSASFSFDVSNMNRFALFLIDFGVFLTEDGGATFKNLPLPWVSVDLRAGRSTTVGALCPVPGSGVIVTATGGWDKQVLAVSRDGGDSWDLFDGVDRQPDTADSYRFIAFHPQNPDVVYAGRYRSLDRGKTWQALPRRVEVMFPGNGDVVYSVSEEPEQVVVFQSTDRGTTWRQVFAPLQDVCPSGIAVDPLDETRVYLTSYTVDGACPGGVYIWEADRAAWFQVGEQQGLEKDRLGSLGTLGIAIDPNRPNIVYVGKWNAGRGQSNGVFRSLDSGRTWEDITFDLGPEFTPWAIAVDPHNGRVFMGSSHGTRTLCIASLGFGAGCGPRVRRPSGRALP